MNNNDDLEQQNAQTLDALRRTEAELQTELASWGRRFDEAGADVGRQRAAIQAMGYAELLEDNLRRQAALIASGQTLEQVRRQETRTSLLRYEQRQEQRQRFTRWFSRAQWSRRNALTNARRQLRRQITALETIRQTQMALSENRRRWEPFAQQQREEERRNAELDEIISAPQMNQTEQPPTVTPIENQQRVTDATGQALGVSTEINAALLNLRPEDRAFIAAAVSPPRANRNEINPDPLSELLGEQPIALSTRRQRKEELWLQWDEEKRQGALNQPYGRAFEAAVAEAEEQYAELTERIRKHNEAVRLGRTENRVADIDDTKEILQSWRYRKDALPLHLAIQLHPSYLPEGCDPEKWKDFQHEPGSSAMAVLCERAPEMVGFDDPAIQAKLRKIFGWMMEDKDRRAFMLDRIPEALGACNNRLARAVAMMEKDRINYEMRELESPAQVLVRGVKELFYENVLQKIGHVDAAGRGKTTELVEGANAYLTEVGSQMLGMKGPLPKRSHPGAFPLTKEQAPSHMVPSERAQLGFQKKLALDVIVALEGGKQGTAAEKMEKLVKAAAKRAYHFSQNGEKEKAVTILEILSSQLGPNVLSVLAKDLRDQVLIEFAPVIKERALKAVDAYVKKSDEIGAMRVLNELLAKFGPHAMDVLKNDEATQFVVLEDLMDEIVEKHRKENGERLALPTAAEYLPTQIDRWGEELKKLFPDSFQKLQQEEEENQALLQEVRSEIERLENSPDRPAPPKNADAMPVLTDEIAKDEEKLREYRKRAQEIKNEMDAYQGKLKEYRTRYAAWEKDSGYLDADARKQELLEEIEATPKKTKVLEAKLTQEFLNFRTEVLDRLKNRAEMGLDDYQLRPMSTQLLDKFANTPEQRERVSMMLRDIEMGLVNEVWKKDPSFKLTLSGEVHEPPEQSREHWLRAQSLAVPMSQKQKYGYAPKEDDYKALENKIINKFERMTEVDIKDIFASVEVLDEQKPVIRLGRDAVVAKVNPDTGNALVIITGKNVRQPVLIQVSAEALKKAMQTQPRNIGEEIEVKTRMKLPGGLEIRWEDRKQAAQNSQNAPSLLTVNGQQNGSNQNGAVATGSRNSRFR